MPIDKSLILQEVILRLERELETHHSAAMEAKMAATHEESKPENKYDTRGLEASYLAAGQARRVEELREVISLLRKCEMKDYSSESPLGVFALITTEVEDRGEKSFFLVPKQGGETITVEDREILTLSLESPLGRRFVGKKQGDVIEFVSQGQNREYEIISVQ